MAEGNERLSTTDAQADAADALLAAREMLSHDEWEALVQVLLEVTRLPGADVEGAARHALLRMCGVLRAGAGSVILMSRKKPPVRSYRPLDGWRPVYAAALTHEGHPLDHLIEPFFKNGDYLDDPAARAAAADAGRHRAYLCRELVDDEQFDTTPLAETFDVLGTVDRVFAVLPVSPQVEAALWLDRPRGAPHFNASDRRVLLEAVRVLAPVLTSLARVSGYVDCNEPLTPKERQVLQQLLTGQREADIAAALGMGKRSLHQRVIDIYRKFGVSSRPQLMALCLNAAPADGLRP